MEREARMRGKRYRVAGKWLLVVIREWCMRLGIETDVEAVHEWTTCNSDGTGCGVACRDVDGHAQRDGNTRGASRRRYVLQRV